MPPCAKTETVEMNILVTSKNGDRKIMQSVRLTRTNSANLDKSLAIYYA